MPQEPLDHDAIKLNRTVLIYLFAHDLFEKPVPTFPDHALTDHATRTIQRRHI
jgi:hypothetical protein